MIYYYILDLKWLFSFYSQAKEVKSPKTDLKHKDIVPVVLSLASALEMI